MWILVALVHVKATAIAWGPMAHRGWSDADLTQLFLLSASNLFFLLEIIFAPCLRLMSDRRAAIAFLLIVAILHAGVIEHGLPRSDSPQQLQLWICTAGAAALAWRRLVRFTHQVLNVMCRATSDLRWKPRPSLAAHWRTIPLCSRAPLCGWRRAALRAPPASM